MQTTKKIKYLLLAIETALSRRELTGEDISVEHILPDIPDGDWIASFGDEWEDCTDRLGNMTLLTERDNKAAARKPFAEKKKLYEKSGFKIAEKLARYEEWNQESVSAYQQWLAEQAANTWRVDFS